MRNRTAAYSLGLGVAWLAIAVVTVRAYASGGGDAGGAFMDQFRHPWSAQFSADLVAHALLAASWMIFRARSWALGLLWAVLAVALGSLFTLAYVLILFLQARGDVRTVLLGRHASPASSRASGLREPAR